MKNAPASSVFAFVYLDTRVERIVADPNVNDRTICILLKKNGSAVFNMSSYNLIINSSKKIS